MTSDYGTYRLTYTPPASDGNEYYPNIAIEMSTSGDANVDQMLRFYEAFLSAAGYVLKGELQVVDPPSYGSYSFGATSTGANVVAIGSTPPSSIYGGATAADFSDDGFSFVGNPIYGGYGNDIISFG